MKKTEKTEKTEAVKNKKNGNTKIIRRLAASLMPVQAMAIGLPAVNTLLSSIIIGNFLGKDALAAMGFAGPLLLVISAVTRMIAGGTQIIAGQAVGRGDKKGLVRVFNTTMLTGAVFAIISGVLCLALPEWFAVIQGATGTNTQITADFIRGVGIGMGFSAMSACVFSFLQLERMDKFSTVLSVIMIIVNVGGNAANVLWLNMGLFGAGMFLSLSNVVAVVIGLIWLLKKSGIIRLDIKSFSIKEAWEILKLGSPNAVISLTCVVRNRVMNHYVFMLGGNVAMAALAVADNFTTAVGCVVQAGYTGSCEIVSGMLLGQRDVKSLRKMPEVMIKSLGWLYAVAYAVVFIFAKPFALLMGAEAQYIGVYILIIRMYNLWYFTNIFAVPPRELYELQGNIGLSALLNIFGNAICPVVLSILFAKTLGLWFTVSMPWIAEIPEFIVLAIIFRIKAKRMPRSPFELCYVPSSISVPREDRFDAAIGTVEDAVRVSENAMSFCREKKLDEKTVYYCGLFIEEFAVDAVKNRLSRNNDILDLRMIYENGHLRLLFRDDCELFDPVEWLKLCRPEDASRSIGIKAVSKLATKMEYINTLKLNVLILEI